MVGLKALVDVFSVETLFVISEDVFNAKYIQDAIISLSQEKLNDGEDSAGKKLSTDKSDPRLGVYSPANPKNATQKHVDLDLTGKFRKSFDLKVKKTYAELTANFKKGRNSIYDNFTASYSDAKTFEEMILSLRDEDWKVFIERVFIPALVRLFEKEISKVISSL